MSRIGNKPIEVPEKVSVAVSDDSQLSVEGPSGKLEWVVPDGIELNQEESTLVLTRQDDSRKNKAMHGTARSLVANMVEEGKTPELSVSDLSDMGYQVILRPISALLAVVKTLQQSYGALLNDDIEAMRTISRLTFQEYNQVVKLSEHV